MTRPTVRRTQGSNSLIVCGLWTIKTWVKTLGGSQHWELSLLWSFGGVNHPPMGRPDERRERNKLEQRLSRDPSSKTTKKSVSYSQPPTRTLSSLNSNRGPIPPQNTADRYEYQSLMRISTSVRPSCSFFMIRWCSSDTSGPEDQTWTQCRYFYYDWSRSSSLCGH